jgi:hypothetical protein
MYGGSITGNTTTLGGSGGGVFVDSSGTFEMYGGSITGNTAATSGGGVYNDGASTNFKWFGGTISGNTAPSFPDHN